MPTVVVDLHQFSLCVPNFYFWVYSASSFHSKSGQQCSCRSETRKCIKMCLMGVSFTVLPLFLSVSQPRSSPLLSLKRTWQGSPAPPSSLSASLVSSLTSTTVLTRLALIFGFFARTTRFTAPDWFGCFCCCCGCCPLSPVKEESFWCCCGCCVSCCVEVVVVVVVVVVFASAIA